MGKGRHLSAPYRIPYPTSMPVIRINDLHQPELAVFATLTEAQLRNRLEPEKGMFIAESPKVIRTAMQAGMQPLALLCEDRHIEGDAADIIALHPDMPVYTGSRELLTALTGYTLTRGVLCAMRRPKAKTAAEVCEGARRICIIHSVTDTTNIGAIFRSAAALGIDAILLTPDTCDPLNRRAVRVSMGSVFLVPWAWLAPSAQEQEKHSAGKPDTPDAAINNPAWMQHELHRLGFRSAALALTERSISLTDPCLMDEPKLAIILGTEGDGLPQQTISAADYVVRIPMAHGVDSLNVAAASAVAFWQLRK